MDQLFGCIEYQISTCTVMRLEINQTLSRGKTAGPKAVHVDSINTYELELI